MQVLQMTFQEKAWHSAGRQQIREPEDL